MDFSPSLARVLGFWFLLGAPLAGRSQALSALDSLSSWPRQLYLVLEDVPFPLHHVQAHGMGHGWRGAVPTEVELSNLWVPAPNVPQAQARRDTVLVTLSVLPDETGRVRWHVVALDTVPPSHLRSARALAGEASRHLAAHRQAGQPPNRVLVTRLNVFPLVHRAGHDWAPDGPVLTEFFVVRPRATRFLAWTDYVTLNVRSPRLDQEAPWRTVRTLLPAGAAYPWQRVLPMGLVPAGVSGGTYEFWYRPAPTASHGSLREAGSGAFTYRAGVGLLTGEYTQYLAPWASRRSILSRWS